MPTTAPKVRAVAPANAAGLTKRQILDRKFLAHWQERGQMVGQWQQVNDAMRPARARWIASTGVTAKSQGRILNNIAGRSVRTWSAGAMMGLSNPASQWFEITTTDYALDQLAAVKAWRTDVRDRILAVMDRSNFYTEAEVIYADVAMFGTACMSIEEDSETTIRCTAHAIGSFAIGHDSKRRVNQFYREWSMTAAQMAEMFGRDALSEQVRTALDRPDDQARFTVRHAIYPNASYSATAGAVDSTRKAFAECYWEPASTSDASDRFLRESGYDAFPCPTPRWGPLAPDDVYGTDYPGVMALGDALMLNEMERQGLNGLRKMVTPPTVSGPAWKNKQIWSVPGANNVEDATQGEPTLRAMYEVALPLQFLEAKIERVENRIAEVFYVPLMTPLLDRLQQDNEQPTAAQAYIARDEQYGMLGPVIERMADDFHDPAIDRIFGIMWRRGEIPPPPIEAEGRPLRVRLRSRMADAQKSQGTTAIERHMQTLIAVAANAPQLAPILDTLDGDEAARKLGEARGVPPTVVRDEAQTAEVRRARAAAQQAAQTAAAAPGIAKAVESLGKTDMGKDSALTRLVGAAGAAR